MKGCSLLQQDTGDAGGKGKHNELDHKHIQHHTAVDEAELDCIVCMSAKKDTIFYKCGHLGTLSFLCDRTAKRQRAKGNGRRLLRRY